MPGENLEAIGIVMCYVDWLLTIPIAVYTQLILLMMNSNPARNM
jgi:hypothetical protein